MVPSRQYGAGRAGPGRAGPGQISFFSVYFLKSRALRGEINAVKSDFYIDTYLNSKEDFTVNHVVFKRDGFEPVRNQGFSMTLFFTRHFFFSPKKK